MLFKALAVVSVAVCFSVFVFAEPKVVSKVCLGCICDAASGCNTAIGCNGDICGPFNITQSYWSDGGKPTIEGDSESDDNAYSNCVNDAFCAAIAVQQYMQKYTKDCNGDGAINCDDYVRMHFLGAFACTGTLDPRVESDYTVCRDAFKQS